jgi:hypothetical protein
MCYLPEWDMVNNNNKYTHNINGDINGMLTGTHSSLFATHNERLIYQQTTN